MGIYDREYYREESGGWWSSVHGHRTTWALITITVGVFIAQVATAQRLGEDSPWTDKLSEWLAFSLPDILRGQVWRLLFTPFLHSPYSLIGVGLGMLCLYWFGTSLEEIYGAPEFAAFYVAAAFLAACGKFLFGLSGLDPSPTNPGCGPALTAVLVLFACHFPYHRIRIFFLIPVPAWLVATISVGFSVLGVYGGSFEPVANLVAAGFAFAYFKWQGRITNLVPSFARQTNRRRRPALRVMPEPLDDADDDDSTPPPPAAATPSSRSGRGVDEQLEAKLDQVLEKVARYGRDSLTSDERDILQRASEIYRTRRGR